MAEHRAPSAIRLSVNVNKVATLRNARGGREPRLLEAVEACVRAGAPGITVHPRADRRHITPDDVYEVASALIGRSPKVEFNIEGDPRPDLLALVQAVVPDQCTLVPVVPGEITSQAGWTAERAADLTPIVAGLKDIGVRVSLFVDATVDAVRVAASTGADRVELYTEPFARAFERGETDGRRALSVFAHAAEAAHSLGLGVNAGHDLDLDNLVLFRDLPYLDEVSIGHALMSRALFNGLEPTVREYLTILAAARTFGP